MDEGGGDEREGCGVKEIWIKDEGRKMLGETGWRREEGNASMQTQA